MAGCCKNKDAGETPALPGGVHTPLATWCTAALPRKILPEEAIRLMKTDNPGAQFSRPHKAWHDRGYLPHFDEAGTVQFLTFRLVDAVPAATVTTWKTDLKLSGGEKADDPRCARLRGLIERFADQGHGACWLKDGRVAQVVQDALLHFDGERYRLLAWVIMPNHVHAVIETLPGFPLDGVIHSWKSFTAKRANRLLGRSGAFWMGDYFDRYVRDEAHLWDVRRYMEENPVKAGLVRAAREWPWMGGCLRE